MLAVSSALSSPSIRRLQVAHDVLQDIHMTFAVDTPLQGVHQFLLILLGNGLQPVT